MNVTRRKIMTHTPGLPVFNTEHHRQTLRDEQRRHRHNGFDIHKLWQGPLVIILFMTVMHLVANIPGSRALRDKAQRHEITTPYNENSPFPLSERESRARRNR